MAGTEFAGRVAVVTGGSSGIGGAVVEELCRLGCKVHFCSRHGDENGYGGKWPALAFHAQCDLTSPQAIQDWVGSVVEREGRIDYLVNNVAFDGRTPFDGITAEAFDRFVSVNLRAAVLMTRAALDGLRRGEGRAIVNLGTTNWMLGLSPFTLYSSTKSGLVGFTRALARELGRERIRANMVSPGWVMTAKQLELYVTEQDKADLLRDQSLPFLMEERHIVSPVLFLLSKGAEAVTGQNLVVDCGKFMQ
jgi:NAD(P)-dependent dehydrogenase (short-subunit alcohol dehydrogenase family)